MGTNVGPDIVSDGLVLALDAADNNSFRGEPTTNYGPSSFGDWGTEATAERIATGNTFKGQPTYNCRTEVGALWKGINKTISGLRTAAGSSGTVTVSCYIRNNNSTSYNCNAYIGYDFYSNRNIAANSDWQRIQWTVNQSNMNNDLVEFRPYTNNASIYLEMTMPQIEVNVGTATRFTTGTRGTTVASGGGWADISGNSNHGEILNGTSTSNDNTVLGALDFDGVNDYIDLGTQLNSLTTFAVEGVFKTDLTSGDVYQNIWGAGTDGSTSDYTGISIGNFTNSYSDESFHATVNGTTYQAFVRNGSNFYFDNKYHHFVVNIESGNNTIYIDGNQQPITYRYGSINTDTDGLNGISNNNTYIGRRSYAISAGYFNGKIPLIRIYNRGLTSDEVKNNYNSLKSRFGL